MELKLIEGFLEVVKPLQIRGWAIDVTSPERRVQVVATIGDEVFARGIADIIRDDLAEVGLGDGRQGFILNLATELSSDDQLRITVYAEDVSGSMVMLCRLLQPEPAASRDSSASMNALDFRGQVGDAAHRPLFILGAARSGTSALAQSLLTSTRFEGYEEGHLLDLAIPLNKTIEDFFEERSDEWAGRRTLIAAVGKDFVHDWSKQVFIEVARRLFPNGYWLDKTPRTPMISASPLLLKTWPNARFIYMKRRGIENIISRLRKFPNISFEEHCIEWAESLREWHRIHLLLSGHTLELDQLFIAREPSTAVLHIKRFLDLDNDEHQRLEAALTHERPERTAKQFGGIVSLSDTGWTPIQQEIFRCRCGDMMRLYGYSEEASYFEAGSNYSSIRVI